MSIQHSHLPSNSQGFVREHESMRAIDPDAGDAGPALASPPPRGSWARVPGRSGCGPPWSPSQPGGTFQGDPVERTVQGRARPGRRPTPSPRPPQTGRPQRVTDPRRSSVTWSRRGCWTTSRALVDADDSAVRVPAEPRRLVAAVLATVLVRVRDPDADEDLEEPAGGMHSPRASRRCSVSSLAAGPTG